MKRVFRIEVNFVKRLSPLEAIRFVHHAVREATENTKYPRYHATDIGTSLLSGITATLPEQITRRGKVVHFGNTR